jgi:large subunit ribosomal protein L32
MRHTRAHTANRRSHHAVTGPRLAECSKCKSSHVKHHACGVCGTYRGKAVLNVMKKVEKKTKKTPVKKEKATKEKK